MTALSEANYGSIRPIWFTHGWCAPPVAWLFSHAKKSLSTREDTFNVHKTFGFHWLLHYVRFSQVGPADCGFGLNTHNSHGESDGRHAREPHGGASARVASSARGGGVAPKCSPQSAAGHTGTTASPTSAAHDTFPRDPRNLIPPSESIDNAVCQSQAQAMLPPEINDALWRSMSAWWWRFPPATSPCACRCLRNLSASSCRTGQQLEALERTGDSPLLSPEEAVALVRRGDRSVGALSYGWLSAGDPDPVGMRMAVVRRAPEQFTHEGAGFGTTRRSISTRRAAIAPRKRQRHSSARRGDGRCLCERGRHDRPADQEILTRPA